ncbi:hypothetical protein Sste5346_000881 [Sporothrix stenoceras]|uniref:Alpha/beta hydrolase fold-3 domain-containing protein n=1 Tax=Sporothrix stenoceras TaxID=5173 RepID=A0ABR3ZRZ3_9PEZI
MKLKETPEYITLNDPEGKGGPRNGHYAELDPHFAAAREGAEAIMATLWNADDWETFRNNWKGEAPLPEGTPKLGEDVEESYIKVPARDGHQIELKVLKSAKHTKSAATADDTIVVLRMHGGGWAIGWHNTEIIENHHAASHPNVVLVSIDYRLAPEHPFPTPLNDCVDVFKWVKANAREKLFANPDKIVLLGGSAGSGLSLGLALKARDEKIGGIIALALDWPTGAHPKFFPELREKFGYELDSYSQVPQGVVAGALIMEFFLDAYTPNVQRDQDHSPLLAETFAGLPPAFLQIAGFDPLRDEGLAVAEKLQRGGVPTEVHVYRGLPHCFSMLFTDLPQAKDYQARQNAFLEKTIKLANAK